MPLRDMQGADVAVAANARPVGVATRFVAEFVDALDRKASELASDRGGPAGRPAYHPRAQCVVVLPSRLEVACRDHTFPVVDWLATTGP